MLNDFYDINDISAKITRSAEAAAVAAETSRDRFLILAKCEIGVKLLHLHHDLMRYEMANGAENEVKAAINSFESIVPALAQSLSMFIPTALPFATEHMPELSKETAAAFGKILIESMSGYTRLVEARMEDLQDIVQKVKAGGTLSQEDIASIKERLKPKSETKH